MTEADSAKSPHVTSKPRITWTHPLTLLVIGTAVSAAGWAINHFIVQHDRSDLRLEIEGLNQAIGLLGAQPHVNGFPVYCDTAKLTLVLAHNGDGRHPILINSVSMKVERVPPRADANKSSCAVDTLASKPFGIVLRNTYVMDVSQGNPLGRFIESAKPGAALKVDPDNILEVGNQKYAVTLRPDEEPLGYDVFVEAMTPGLYRIWFTAEYDASGKKVEKTQSFLLEK
jgi:hypothetical protein